MADTAKIDKPARGCTIELLNLATFCPQADSVTYVTGCVNEHLDEDRYCGRHLDLLMGGSLLCTVCWRLGVRVPVTALAVVASTGERIRVGAGVGPDADPPARVSESPLAVSGADRFPD